MNLLFVFKKKKSFMYYFFFPLTKKINNLHFDVSSLIRKNFFETEKKVILSS
jgi:hypothetical protein